MSDIVIKAENLGKQYRIGQLQHKYETLRDKITEGVGNIFHAHETFDETHFWALKDVSFEIRQGEVVGIIGRNGAGKSTLLKILSKITEPTKGRVELHGRVGSLLEVGTGFHSELTGRENIFLNGAILGMKRTEIKSKFDEIVAFAEVDKFIDTAVKHYSSGMYMRLAFAVAAYLEPEILLVDEVLAVGDAQFQKKCLGKMGEIAGQGRTILLVSHSMTTVKALAHKAIFLENGQSRGVEDVTSAVSQYLYGPDHSNIASAKIPPDLKRDAYIIEARIHNDQDRNTERFATYENINIEMTWVNKKGVPTTPNIMVVNQNGVTALIAMDTPIDFDGEKKRAKGVYRSTFTIPGNLLNGSDYTVHLALDNHSPRICYDHHLDVLRCTIWDPMDERCLARGCFKISRDDAVLWPALPCRYEKLS